MPLSFRGLYSPMNNLTDLVIDTAPTAVVGALKQCRELGSRVPPLADAVRLAELANYESVEGRSDTLPSKALDTLSKARRALLAAESEALAAERDLHAAVTEHRDTWLAIAAEHDRAAWAALLAAADAVTAAAIRSAIASGVLGWLESSDSPDPGMLPSNRPGRPVVDLSELELMRPERRASEAAAQAVADAEFREALAAERNQIRYDEAVG